MQSSAKSLRFVSILIGSFQLSFDVEIYVHAGWTRPGNLMNIHPLGKSNLSSSNNDDEKKSLNAGRVSRIKPMKLWLAVELVVNYIQMSFASLCASSLSSTLARGST
jgi:hypothetical protein